MSTVCCSSPSPLERIAKEQKSGLPGQHRRARKRCGRMGMLATFGKGTNQLLVHGLVGDAVSISDQRSM